MEPAVHRVTSPSSPDFDALVAIYTAAHPASERKPVSLLTAMVQRPDYVFDVATLHGAVTGFTITLVLPQSDACLLEYMAVAESHQNQGIGKFLFHHLAATPEVATRYLLAEVDSDKLPTPDRAERTRRKRFYRNLGAREVEVLNYLMPPVSTSAPPAMDLFVYRRELPPAIPKPQLRAWLESIYVNVYAMQPDDPRIDKMVERLPGTLTLV